jgi:hypothetical protein
LVSMYIVVGLYKYLSQRESEGEMWGIHYYFYV